MPFFSAEPRYRYCVCRVGFGHAKLCDREGNQFAKLPKPLRDADPEEIITPLEAALEEARREIAVHPGFVPGPVI